jgi:electron transport complex protein RnfG
MMLKESLLKNGVMLGAFAVVTTALIALTFFGTRDTIAQKRQQKLLSVLNEVVPKSYHNNALYADCTLVSDTALGSKENYKVYRARQNGQPSALVLEATAPDGYSGNIDMVIGVSTEMTVLGVRVIDHKETPGLGDKVELAISDWITSFTGKTFDNDNLSPWNVKKDGGEFDQFTGATITPRAVVGAVRRALAYTQTNQSTLFSAPNACTTANTKSNETNTSSHTVEPQESNGND